MPEREYFIWNKKEGVVSVETHYVLFRKPNRVVRPAKLIDSIEIQHYSYRSRFARVPAGDEDYTAQQAQLSGEDDPSGKLITDRNLARLVLNCSDGRVFLTSTNFFKNAEGRLREIAATLAKELNVPVHTDLPDDDGFEDQGAEWFITEKERKAQQNKPPLVLNAPVAKSTGAKRTPAKPGNGTVVKRR